MKFNDQSQMATKRYIEKCKLPDGFQDKDTTNFKMYLVYKFHMDMTDMKKGDLKGDDKETFEKLEVYKQYVNNSLYKDVLNWILLNKIGKKVKKKDKKKDKAAMVEAGIPKESEQKTKQQVVVYYKRQSRLAAFMNRAADKLNNLALDASLAVNRLINGDAGF